MTAREAEQKVRERYPNAVCRKRTIMGDHREFQVYESRKYVIPIGPPEPTKAEAWKGSAYRVGAARRLTGE